MAKFCNLVWGWGRGIWIMLHWLLCIQSKWWHHRTILCPLRVNMFYSSLSTIIDTIIEFTKFYQKQTL